MDELFEVCGFAGAAECSAVVAAYERCRCRYAANAGNAFWDGRVLGIGSFPDSENEVRRTLQRWRHRATAIAALHAGRTLFPDTILVVRWDGQAMPAHRDHCNADGTPNGTPWREWASIVYLNDNYEGGRLTFPESGRSYRPVAGSLLVFPASAWHGVEEAEPGTPRYTSALWFTSDPEHVDPLSAVTY